MKKIIIFLILLTGIFIGIKSYNYKVNDKYSFNGDLIKQVSSNTSNYTTIDKIPQNLKNAIISIEDKRFYKHKGFDVKAIARSILTDLKERKVKVGGSTITQQLIKNLFLSSEKTIYRKIKEIFLAIKLEKKYSKDEILEMYLNLIYFGDGAYGIQNASQKYFHKNVWELSLDECAMLAGLPQAPSAYNPNKNYEMAKKRQQQVLNSMIKNGFINKNTEKSNNKQMIFVGY
ncbi:transglycosylase domain-containing protein [Haloimpatiens sp. FM7330]|uniref:transglycosylase domain-containing protein n=1 Tax=Haloimpatiens sp. FM7330 TaxID=3298610 RepID=UPI003625F98D